MAEKGPPATLTGRLVHPGDPDYVTSSTGWDQLFTHYPMVIVFAQETQDVVNALTWARQNDVAVRVRSGRHCLEGWNNVDNGIVIDVSEIKGAKIDKGAGTAIVGAGLNQMEAITALGKEGFAAPTGTEGTVGLVGATLGGGFGLLSRSLRHGLGQPDGSRDRRPVGCRWRDGAHRGRQERAGSDVGAARRR